MTQAILWMDHTQAHLIELKEEGFEHTHIKSHSVHLHNHAHGDGHRGHADPEFFKKVDASVATYTQIYLVGPGNGKDEWKQHLDARAPQLAKKIVEVASADHPTPGELATLGRTFFNKYGKMHGVHV